jgi:hypothetical protein
VNDEHQHLYERLEKRIDALEAELKALRGTEIRKLEEFRKMVQVSLLTIFAVITYVSSEGWDILRKIFTRGGG